MPVTAERERGKTAVVGVAEHGNSAVLVTVSSTTQMLDRRTVDLTGPDLPTHPYHHEGSWAVGRYRDSAWARDVTLPEAVALVRKVQAAAAEGAVAILRALAADLPVPVGGIAIRSCPELPETIEARIRDNRAQTVADTVMYRQALAEAASARAGLLPGTRRTTYSKPRAGCSERRMWRPRSRHSGARWVRPGRPATSWRPPRRLSALQT